MTEQAQFLDMLARAEIAWSVRRTSTHRDLVELQSGGAVAFFEFDDDGMLVDFDIDREAY